MLVPWSALSLFGLVAGCDVLLGYNGVQPGSTSAAATASTGATSGSGGAGGSSATAGAGGKPASCSDGILDGDESDSRLRRKLSGV